MMSEFRTSREFVDKDEHYWAVFQTLDNGGKMLVTIQEEEELAKSFVAKNEWDMSDFSIVSFNTIGELAGLVRVFR